MDPRWRLDGDALDAAGLRVTWQRIDATHWNAAGPLRSWGLAPLYRDGDVLCIPCADDEVLWLGAWAEPPAGQGWVELRTGDGADTMRIEIPRQSAIAALRDASPIARTDAEPARELQLALASDGGPSPAVQLTVRLLAPEAWSARSGRAWMPLSGPPPRPPRLG